jgi:hypothetical protein
MEKSKQKTKKRKIALVSNASKSNKITKIKDKLLMLEERHNLESELKSWCRAGCEKLEGDMPGGL